VSTMAKRLPLLGNAGAVDESSECSDVKLDRLEEARRTNGLLSWIKIQKRTLVIIKLKSTRYPYFYIILVGFFSLSKFNSFMTKKSEKTIKGNIWIENMTQDCIIQNLTQKQIQVTE